MKRNRRLWRLQEGRLALRFDTRTLDLEASGEILCGDGAIFFEDDLQSGVAVLEVAHHALDGGLAELDRFEDLLGVLEVDLVELLVGGPAAGDVIADFVSDRLVEVGLSLGVHLELHELAVDPLGVDGLEDHGAVVIRLFDVAGSAQLDESITGLRANLAEDGVGDVVVDSLIEDCSGAAVALVEFFDGLRDKKGEWDLADFGQLLLHIQVLFLVSVVVGKLTSRCQTGSGFSASRWPTVSESEEKTSCLLKKIEFAGSFLRFRRRACRGKSLSQRRVESRLGYLGPSLGFEDTLVGE